MVPQEQGNSFSIPTQLPNEFGLQQRHFFLRLSYFLSLLSVVTVRALKSIGHAYTSAGPHLYLQCLGG